MRDKRAVDELSVEELERVLAIRRREDRQKRLERMKSSGRVVETPNGKKAPPASSVESTPFRQEEGAEIAAIPAATITLDALDAILQRKDAPPKFEETPLVVAEKPHLDVQPIQPELTARDRRSNRLMNGLLVLIEVAAVAGLIFIGVGLYTETMDLQQESAEVQRVADEQRRAAIPTIAPTSVIQVAKLEDFVLPGGHVIDADGRASFNLGEFIDEVPTHLREDVVRQALSIDLIRAEKTSETPLQVFIPKLNVDAVIVQGTDWNALQQGVGQVQNGAFPADQDGNVALAAHNDIYGALFKDIPELVAGDLIQVQTETQTFNYRVTHTEVVDPTDVSVLQNQGKPTVTLITCYPPGVNNKRWIVYADREDTFEVRS